MRLNEDLERVCNVLSNELHKVIEKVEKSGSSEGAIEYLDKLTHAIKSVKTTMAMMGSESSYSNGNSYDYSNRGRGYARRDSMGRYMDAYSGASEMAQRLKEMADDIPDAHKRNEFMRLIAMAENDG